MTSSPPFSSGVPVDISQRALSRLEFITAISNKQKPKNRKGQIVEKRPPNGISHRLASLARIVILYLKLSANSNWKMQPSPHSQAATGFSTKHVIPKSISDLDLSSSRKNRR
jgi:hypothetical protein